MSTAELKLHLHQLIDGIKDPSILEAVHTLIKSSSDKDWWDDLPENSKEKTLESLRQAKSGDTISHEDAMKKMSEKFPQLRF